MLAGVLVLVPDVRGYLLEHVKGIARLVEDHEIPKVHRAAFAKARKQIAVEHIEEDLEAERVTSLYVMNHYLSSQEVSSPSPEIDELIKKYWDKGPFFRIREQLKKLSARPSSLVELGCGVGGLYVALRDQLETYLGLDSSFASIALARHFALGAPMRGKTLLPGDLLAGPVSREAEIKSAGGNSGRNADFIVCELDHPPVKAGQWQLTAALNVIDMLAEPQALPRLQYELLANGGRAIQSCPYIWHQQVSAELRELLPKTIIDSAKAVEWLYESTGFKIDSSEPHVPWLFFKHFRQLEIYSVHLFFASK